MARSTNIKINIKLLHIAGTNDQQISPGEDEEAGERRLTIGQSEASAFQVVKSASSQGCHGRMR